MKLSEGFDINIGMVLSRKKAKKSVISEYRYRLLTLKSVSEVGEINDLALEEFISDSEIDTNYLTQKGDVIVRLTEPYSAIYIGSDNEHLLVPSNFAIIRSQQEKYISEFIQCYFNAYQGKNIIRRMAAGSALSAISIASLKEIEIKQYSKEQQEKFIVANKLFLKEKKLFQKLIEERDKQLQGINQEILKVEDNR